MALNSQTSSQLPSNEGSNKPPPRKRQSSARKRGGQPGHKDSTLRESETLDVVVDLKPTHCHTCQFALNPESTLGQSPTRQVFDLPPDLRLQVVEHQTPMLVCQCCRTANRAAFPPEVSARMQYGPLEAGWALTLHDEHAVASSQLSDLLRELLGGGTLVNLTRRTAQALEPRRKERLEALAASPVSHADETGLRVAGRTRWVHVWSAGPTVELRLEECRGTAAMGHLENYAGTLVHDSWASYRSRRPASTPSATPTTYGN